MKQKHITITLALTMCLVSACNKKTNEQEEKIKSVGYVDTTIEKEHDCSVHEGEEHSQHEHTENEHSEDEYEPVSKNGTAIKDVVGDFDEEDTQKALGKPTTPIEAVEHEIVREQENKDTQYKYNPKDTEENINWVLNRVESVLVGDIREGELRNISAQTPFTEKLVGFLHSEFGTNPENQTNILELFNNVSQIDKFKTEIAPYVEDCSKYENTETMCNGGVSFPNDNVANNITNKMNQVLENLTPIGKQLIESNDLLYPLSMEVSDNIVDKDPRLIVKDDKIVMLKDDIELSNTVVGLEDDINYRGLMFAITSYDQFGDKILARRKDEKYVTDFEYNKVASNDNLIKYEIKNQDISIQVMVDFILNSDGTIKDITINRTR
jgi:hypothetical protein